MKFLNKVMFSPSNTPFLFQHEYYNVGRSFIHEGKFLHPQFGWFEYPEVENQVPRNWNHCFKEKNQTVKRSIRNFYGYLTPDDLFQNLENCKLEFSGSFNSIDVRELLEILNNDVKFEYKLTPICDGGYESINIYIYIKELKLYRRFTLKHSGEFTIDQKSERINNLLKQVGFDKMHT